MKLSNLKKFMGIALVMGVFMANAEAKETKNVIRAEKLKLESKWDKTFPQSDKVNHKKVTFVNHFGITLAADMYTPKASSLKGSNGKLPAIAVYGYFDSNDEDARYKNRATINAQRTADYKAGSYAMPGGLPPAVQEEAPQFLKDYVDYYRTKRGYHPRSLNSNTGWALQASTSQNFSHSQTKSETL